MKRSSFLSFLATMLLLIFFAACEKDEVTTVENSPITPTVTTTTTSPVASRLATQGTQPQSSSSSDGLEIECITIDYPFEFLVDTVPYTINSVSDLDDLFTNVVTATTMSIDFAYPLNVTTDDGTAVVAADESELAILVSACIPGSGWGTGSFPAFFFDDASCISLNYPVALTDENGATVSAVDASEFTDLIAANPHYSFVFPLSVVDTTGAVVNVQDETELFDLLAECACPGNGGGHGGNGGGHGIDPSELAFLLGGDCFDYNYPINLIDVAGNSVAVADENGFATLLLNGEVVDFDYPFSVTLEADGSTVTITDSNEFGALFNNCYTFDIGLSASDFLIPALTDSCYSLVYPFTAESSNGTVTVSNAAEAGALLMNNPNAIINLPTDITQAGATVTITSFDDYYDALVNCSTVGGGHGGGGTGGQTGEVPADFFIIAAVYDGSCYTLVYPFDVESTDGTVTTISNASDANAFIQSQTEAYVVWPAEVVETSSGNQVELIDAMEFTDLLVNCQ